MTVLRRFSSVLLFSFLIALLAVNARFQSDHKKVYVVYMGERVKNGVSAASSLHHMTMLENVLGSGAAEERLVYSYQRSFNGFAAKLSDEEAATFAEMEGVVSVIPNKMYQFHTTRSWDFMGLSLTQSGASSGAQADIIVAVIDSGVWPESESFSDEGFGPPPAKWKGSCAANFTCNNKLIGARYYHMNSDHTWPQDVLSPRDTEGHGTHTASTAAGRAVAGANFYGLGGGVARGGAPGARLAIYKVCWLDGCGAADILAAFDDAIADGADVISVSLGSIFVDPYFLDPTSIGSFHAMRRGILTSTSGGNSGPVRMTVENFAPWTLTVAAGTVDRRYVSNVVLGNGQTLMGLSVNPYAVNGTTTLFPLIYGGDAPNFSNGADHEPARLCNDGALDGFKVKGKIVICDAVGDGGAVVEAGGLGIIMSDPEYSTLLFDFAFSYSFPATVVSLGDAEKAIAYARSPVNPTGTIMAGETWGDITAPRVVSFSSRGPNPMDRDILKPDITAPGVDILAAWSPVAPPSSHIIDTRTAEYNIISGTSMACPHATGAAANIKAHRPTWSPAAIKSALMTTALVMDPRRNEDAEFAYGAGHIDPVGALDPGLVYDASERDYVDFLCAHGYNTTTLRLVTGDDSSCTAPPASKRAIGDLNYPTMALPVEDEQRVSGTFYRTVTNVGPANSTYRVTVKEPAGIEVRVQPAELSFAAVGEKRSFRVTVRGEAIVQRPIISAEILWKDGGSHAVRSPVVVYTVSPGSLDYSASVGVHNRVSSSHRGSFVPTKRNVLRTN